MTVHPNQTYRISLRRAMLVAWKDLKLGPRSPIFLWALVLPVVITFLVRAVFGGLLEPPPRLAVVDEGASRLTEQIQQLDGIEVTILSSGADLVAGVTADDYDAGLVLGEAFDADLQGGDTPDLNFYVSGSSKASTRAILGITTLDLLRQGAGQPPIVDVVVTPLGEEDYVPVDDRLLPLVVVYAVVIAGLFLPAASLVDEREKHTLTAVLVSPTRMSEVLLGKLTLGVLLAVVMGWVTLALNDAFASQPVGMTVFLVLGAVMLGELGLMLGSWAKDSNTLFTAIKGGGLLVVMPVLFTLFPSLPQWIAQLFPTYYFLQPIYEVAVQGTSFSDHVPELAVATAICLLLVPGVVAAGRRAERRLAFGS